MAILAGRSHPGVMLSQAEPPNLTEMAQHEPGVIVRGGRLVTWPDGMLIWPQVSLPPNIVALLTPNVPQVLLARRMFPRMSDQALMTQFIRSRRLGGGAARMIEHSRLIRFMLATAFVRWYCWDEALSVEYRIRLSAVPQFYLNARPSAPYHPDKSFAIGFAPVSALPRWTDEHSALYTLLWRYIGQLMAQRSQLAAQTARWMGVSAAPPMDQLMEYVHHAGRRMGAVSPEQARAMFVGYLAEQSRAPATLIRSRLDGDWVVSSRDVWRAISEQLVMEFPELALWRAELAAQRRIPDQEMTLWLMEPADLLWPTGL